MKQSIIKVLSVFLLATLFISCEDFLDAKSRSEMNEDLVFADPVKTEGVLFKIYHFMGTNNSYRNRIILSMDWNTDIEQYSPQNGETMVVDGGNDAAFSWYAVSSGNQRNILTDGWNFIYKAIEQANQIVTGIEKFGDLTNPRTRALYAEAITLRAYLYTDLIKWWGDVPARFENATSDNIFIPATNRTEIYERLLSDLLIAQEYIDWAGEGNASSNVTRVNKAAVKAMRARIAMYAAGYAQYPKDFTPAGQVLKVGTNAQVAKNVTPQRETELYEIARVETKSIIEKYGKSKLINNFEDVWKAISGQKFMWNQTESLWEQAYRNQFMYNTMLLCGTPNRWNAKSGGAGGKVVMVPSFYYDYAAGDSRRDVSAVPYKWTATSPDGVAAPPTDNGVYQELERNFFKITLAKLRAEWLPTGSYMSSSNDSYAHLVVVRYADVLLMYAEACLKTNVDIADGLEKFNWVRERAFGNANNNKAVLTMENIIDERAFEFVGERLRKYDLIRWGLLKSKMDAAISNVYKLEAQEAPYQDVPLSVYTRSVTGPYPNSQILRIWGLNRGEFGLPADVLSFTYTGPIKIAVTNSAIGNKYFLYNVNPTVASANNFDPEFRALIPFHNNVIGTNVNLKNQYGY